MDWIKVPPVFIVGCYRSGTSLLRLMLSGHQRISISAEGAYIYRIGRNLSSYGDLSTSNHLQALHQDISPFLEDERWLTVPPFSELVDWVTRFGTSWRSILTFYGTSDARVQGKEELSWWGDNAPYHVHEIPYFDSLFPESKFILMIRDPRDVYTSIKYNFKENYPLDDVTALWEKALSDGLLAQSVLGRSRLVQVRYERLVTEPREQLEEICGFLGVDFEQQMLAYHESNVAQALSLTGHHRDVVKPVFSTSVGKHLEKLSREEISRIHQRLRLPMRCLGYLSQSEYEEAAFAASGLPRILLSQ
jgi:hypothetical protein